MSFKLWVMFFGHCNLMIRSRPTPHSMGEVIQLLMKHMFAYYCSLVLHCIYVSIWLISRNFQIWAHFKPGLFFTVNMILDMKFADDPQDNVVNTLVEVIKMTQVG